MNTKKAIASNLLEMKAVSLRPNDPYTWASGIKSPIYCDNRLALSFPTHRSTVVNAFIELIQKEYPDVQVLMGTATAGIPWAVYAPPIRIMARAIKLKESWKRERK